MKGKKKAIDFVQYHIDRYTRATKVVKSIELGTIYEITVSYAWNTPDDKYICIPRSFNIASIRCEVLSTNDEFRASFWSKKPNWVPLNYTDISNMRKVPPEEIPLHFGDKHVTDGMEKVFKEYC